MPKLYTLENQPENVVLCLKHARNVKEQIKDTHDKVNTPCLVCTMGQRLMYGSPAQFTLTTANGWIVTRHIDGVISCTCPGWRFQKGVPPTERTCKHSGLLNRSVGSEEGRREQ